MESEYIYICINIYSYKMWPLTVLRHIGCAAPYCVVCLYRKYRCNNYLDNGYLFMG